MFVKANDYYSSHFTTSKFSTGEVFDADALPAAVAWYDQIPYAAFSLTVEREATGTYWVYGQVPVNAVTGAMISILVYATVDGVAGVAVIDHLQIVAEDWVTVAAPTVEQIRTEMDSNSTQLDAIRDDIAAIPAAPTPPTVEQIRTEMDSNSTQLDAIRDDIAAIPAAPTPPTVEQIRTEMDSNSTQLDAIRDDIAAIPAAPTPPTVEQIRTEMDNNSTQLDAIRDDIAAIPAAPTPPTVEQIRTEMDNNSTQLDAIRDDIAAIPGSVPGPTVEEIRTEMDDHSSKLAEILESVWNARTITWDYRGNDFRCMDGLIPVEGATVVAFRQEGYLDGKTGSEYILSQVLSDADGKWIGSMTLDIGIFTLVATKGLWTATMTCTVV